MGQDWKFNPSPDFGLEKGSILIFMTTPAGRERLVEEIGQK